MEKHNYNLIVVVVTQTLEKCGPFYIVLIASCPLLKLSAVL